MGASENLACFISTIVIRWHSTSCYKPFVIYNMLHLYAAHMMGVIPCLSTMSTPTLAARNVVRVAWPAAAATCTGSSPPLSASLPPASAASSSFT